MVKKLDLDYIKKPDGRGHDVMYFTHDALALCREELERREAKKRAKTPAVKIDVEALKAEHPLVTDERCLKLSYWPETIPACLEEAEA